jgi:MoaA/NifB/PqqE/SkfB family radical SAM enzyme
MFTIGADPVALTRGSTGGRKVRRLDNGAVTGQDMHAQVDSDGRITLSPELASRYGIKPGARVYVNELANGLYLLRPATQLAKLYIEPTNLCNLNCRTCVRNVWNEPLGMMSDAVFDRVIEGLRTFTPPPKVFFGGLGEPLLHPKISEMVARAKALGASVELITNGTLLTPDLLDELVSIGIDVLWVSIDGAKPESYADVRLGAALPKVLENLGHFRKTQSRHASLFSGLPQAQLGIVFVAMKRNIADLPAVCELAWQLGAQRFMVTNVLPYTVELSDEVLYHCKLGEICVLDPEVAYRKRPFMSPHIYLPRIDASEITRNPVRSMISRNVDITWADSIFRGTQNRCPFVESGAGAIRWDGNLSPCLPLLHNYVIYLGRWERFLHSWTIGSVLERDLADLWHDEEHIAFRERVQTFDFSPCPICGGCNMLDSNQEDCFSNSFPTCGGCLWAQGVIQCP